MFIKGEKGSLDIEANFKGVKKDEFMKTRRWREVFGLRNLPAKWEEIQKVLNPKKESKQEAKIEIKEENKQGAK